MAVIDRAYIEIVEMRMGALVVDAMVIVKTVFLNVGRLPAWNFRFRSTLMLMEKPLTSQTRVVHASAPTTQGESTACWRKDR